MDLVNNKIDLSIVILSYNSKDDLRRLLPSVLESEGGLVYEIIIVDNMSVDDTREWVDDFIAKSENRKIRLIKNKNNGFATGNNIGIKQAQGKYILILNPDTQLKPDTLQIMLEFMETHSDVGISTCKVLLPDGSLDLACRRRFPNPWNSFKRLFLLSRRDYNFADTDEDQSMEIDSCMGAFMVFRRLPTTHYPLPILFDEDFFMYGEDIDLCWRCKEAGFKVWYYPETSITHFKGSSSEKVPFKALKWFHDAMWIFYLKHYAHRYPLVLNWLIWLGIQFRFLTLIVINSFRTEKFVSKR